MAVNGTSNGTGTAQLTGVVALSLDRSGFIRSIAPSAGAPTPAAAPAAVPSKDVTISRLAILKAAAAFGASRPDLKSNDVLRIAESWEHWINRKEGVSHD